MKLGILPAVISPFALAKIGRVGGARAVSDRRAVLGRARAEIGLVHAVVPASELDAAVGRYVQELLTAGPEAIAAAKALIPEVWGRTIEDAAAVTAAAIAARRVSPEGQEGLRAFLEKRKPSWEGESAVAMIRAPADRQPRRDRAADHSRLPRAGHRERRGLLRGRRGAPHVAAADRAGRDRAGSAADSYLSTPHLIDAARIRRGRGPSRLRFPLGERGVRGRVRAGPASFRRSPGFRHRADGIQDRRAAVPWSGPACPSCRGDTPGRPVGSRHQDRDRAASACRRHQSASAGGGGKGMRRVMTRDEIDESIQAARREAVAAFGDGTLYVERLVERPHHVEVQIVGDRHGHVVHVFERECSVQRRHQKVIEESPSPAITRGLCANASPPPRWTRHGSVLFQSGTVGTVESAPADSDPRAFLLPRDEHAAAGRASGDRAGRRRRSGARAAARRIRRTAAVGAERARQRGHAVEARVYAEDPSRGFLPQAGRLLLYRDPPRRLAFAWTPASSKATRCRFTTIRCSRR